MSTSIQLPGLAGAFFEEVTKKYAPDAKVVKKSESFLMKAIAFILKPFNPSFSHYITTIGKTIYIPDGLEAANEMALLDITIHETFHIIDYVRNKAKFILGYLFPQCLAALSLLSVFAIINPLLFLFLLFLLLLAPLPAPWRYKFERRGYRVSILLGRRLHNFSENQMQQLRDRFKKEMTTGAYYFAWPFPDSIDQDMKDESFMSESDYQVVLQFLKNHKLI